MPTKIGVRIRLAVDGDIGYVAKTWRETYGRESLWVQGMDRHVYHTHHRRLIEELLKSDTTLIACNEADATHIVGFACGTRVDGVLVLHWVGVRHELSGWGVATKLLEAFEHKKGEPIVCTHWTRLCAKLPGDLRLVYNPYVLFRQFRERFDGQKAREPQAEPAGGATGPVGG